MGLTISRMSISLDGFVAGPNQSLENPMGEGGLRIHEWMFETAAWARQQGLEPRPSTPDSDVVDELSQDIGAYVMGRKMFGGGDGTWDSSWKGWWGDDPPYHTPVFVLTHHERDPLKMQGGTTFYFVTDGIDSALARAREAAGDQRVMIAGGAQAVQQYLRAGEIDELTLHLAPVILGAGERLFENVGDLFLRPVNVIASPRVTHIKYRIEH